MILNKKAPMLLDIEMLKIVYLKKKYVIMLHELIKIENIAKNIPLLICIAWLYTQNSRITTLEDKLQSCWLLKTSSYNNLHKLPHIHTNKYAVLPDEIDVKKYIS